MHRTAVEYLSELRIVEFNVFDGSVEALDRAPVHLFVGAVATVHAND